MNPGVNLSLSSWTGPRRSELSIFDNLRDEFMNEIIQPISIDPTYKLLEDSNQCWCIVTANPPHIIVYTTHSFNRLCSSSESKNEKSSLNNQVNIPILGTPLSQLMKGTMTEEGVMEKFTTSVINDKGYGHTLITLHKGPHITNSNIHKKEQTRLNFQPTPILPSEIGDYSLFSIHSYPIIRRAPSNSDTSPFSSSDENNTINEETNNNNSNNSSSSSAAIPIGDHSGLLIFFQLYIQEEVLTVFIISMDIPIQIYG
jgi:hypothetical protein